MHGPGNNAKEYNTTQFQTRSYCSTMTSQQLHQLFSASSFKVWTVSDSTESAIQKLRLEFCNELSYNKLPKLVKELNVKYQVPL